ncbi:nucleotidyltransferase [Hymenobacter bucti]|uniref:Nucleotidyltransferase n=1 Tax=Hymenobacter bucti TaxID=1844114 RepID=A0ABW4QYD5_9BACT
MESEYLNLLRLFREEGVEYVVVGGYAVIAHGFPRTTGDIDLLVRPTVANATRVVRALVRYGFTQGEFEETDFTTIPNFLSFSRQEVWIDLMTQIAGVTFAECATDALVVEVAGVPVTYCNLGALRKAKAATQRPQDMQDLANLPPDYPS